MTNVVGAQAIYCGWTKGKAGTLCIGLMLLHLICFQDKKKKNTSGLESELLPFPPFTKWL